MDRPHGSVELKETLPTLGDSKRLRDSLIKSFGRATAAPMLQMLESHALSGDAGAALHDFLVDEINNECRVAWGTTRVTIDRGEEMEWPLDVCCYEDVYFVRALEHDDAGYFLSLDAAKRYIASNWPDAPVD